MRNATMLYKAPGPEAIHGSFLATLIVDADEEGELDAAIAEGWFLTTPEAIEAYEAEKAEKEAALAAEQFANDGTQSAPAVAKTKKAAQAPAPAANVGTEGASVAWGGTSAPAA